MQVEVTLSNRRAWIINTTDADAPYDLLYDYFSYSDPKARFTPAYKLYGHAKLNLLKQKARNEDNTPPTPAELRALPGWDGKKRFLKYDRHEGYDYLPAGLFRASRAAVEKETDIHFRVKTRWPKVKPFLLGLPKSSAKYKYQDKAADAMCGGMPFGGGLILSATGTGKTNMAAKFFSRVPYKYLFVVDQKDLLYQQQEELALWLGEPVGIVGDSKYELQRVTVATVQTLDLHLEDDKFAEWYDAIQIMIVDELHEQMARRNFSVLERVQPIACYGLTATLQLKKKDIWMRAFSFAGPVLYTFPLSKGVEQKVLSKGAALQLLFPTVRDEDGEDDILTYQEEYAQEVIEHDVKHLAIQQVVKHLREEKRFIIVLALFQAQIQWLHSLLENHIHRVVYGPTYRPKRKEAIEKFEVGKVRLLIASKIFKKGINIKRVDAIIDVAEQNNVNDTQQKYGRGVRLHKNKKELIYIDFGTQGKGRFGKRARRRARALRALGIDVTVAKVRNAREAVEALKKFMRKSCTPIQQELQLSA